MKVPVTLSTRLVAIKLAKSICHRLALHRLAFVRSHHLLTAIAFHCAMTIGDHGMTDRQGFAQSRNREVPSAYSPSRNVSNYSGSDIAAQGRPGRRVPQAPRPRSSQHWHVVPQYYVPFGYRRWNRDSSYSYHWNYGPGYQSYRYSYYGDARPSPGWYGRSSYGPSYGLPTFYGNNYRRSFLAPNCGPIVYPPIVVHPGGAFGAISGQLTGQWLANWYGAPILTTSNAAPPLIARPPLVQAPLPLATSQWNQNWLMQGQRQGERFDPSRNQQQPDAEQEKPKPIPPEMVSRAGKFLGQGDRYLSQGKYHRALQRYKRASDAARELPDPYFRQAFSYASLGMFARARSAIERGISLDPNWPESGFQLEEFAGEPFQAVLDSRFDQALRLNPLDADALYLRAVSRFFAGERVVAEQDFRRVAQLSGSEEHITPFLPPPEEIP